ncbi:DUF6527 family protein [Rhodoferax sp.]|uniref:DUF6527 family protein n=1 Tax=Rhodoferax sp. TaxID=50421 RepID=UPI002767BE35|nr:DUF6527 family protein [Rhodoferax sp.]
MSALSPVLNMVGRYNGPDECHAEFLCPGCGNTHMLGVADGCVGPRWSWNMDKVRPTFQPSVLSRGNKLVKDASGEWTGEWERDGSGNLIPYVCHSYVTDGRIQFLGDCTHALAGQTVDLPAWPT